MQHGQMRGEEVSEDRAQKYSEYLTFRSFYTGFPVDFSSSVPCLRTDEDVIDAIQSFIPKDGSAAILLSGGMDSAILAPFLPKGTAAYTLYYEEIEENELELAQHYCTKFGLRHVPVQVQGEEYMGAIDHLTIRKGMPLSPAEPVFYLGAVAARKDNYTTLITGGGADGKQGGFTKLRHDVSPSKFEKIWQKAYLTPENFLKKYSTISHVISDFLYECEGEVLVDSDKFLWHVGTERFAYDNAIEAAGLKHISPYMKFKIEFDKEINSARSKYRIREIYKKIYGDDPPEKIGMQKPKFLNRNLNIGNNEIFKENLSFSSLPYNRRVLLYFLERFHELSIPTSPHSAVAPLTSPAVTRPKRRCPSNSKEQAGTKASYANFSKIYRRLKSKAIALLR